jgi:NAD(P)-dependent dehydrogenase (short-subunit alcohol dehydrogenase family)
LDVLEHRVQRNLERLATPREIAEVILFLASDRASYLTGATVAADGAHRP